MIVLPYCSLQLIGYFWGNLCQPFLCLSCISPCFRYLDSVGVWIIRLLFSIFPYFDPMLHAFKIKRICFRSPTNHTLHSTYHHCFFFLYTFLTISALIYWFFLMNFAGLYWVLNDIKCCSWNVREIKIVTIPFYNRLSMKST